jgi:hypothetical protein
LFNEYRDLFGKDEKVLKSDDGDGCTILRMVKMVCFMPCGFYHNKKLGIKKKLNQALKYPTNSQC